MQKTALNLVCFLMKLWVFLLFWGLRSTCIVWFAAQLAVRRHNPIGLIAYPSLFLMCGSRTNIHILTLNQNHNAPIDNWPVHTSHRPLHRDNGSCRRKWDPNHDNYSRRPVDVVAPVPELVAEDAAIEAASAVASEDKCIL